ncbi:MAG: hypothetical protein QXI39_01070 [Candidatus Bathyarchaeia archaeon]
MSPINEYIITALIIVSIFVASTIMAISSVTPLRTVFERERLKMASEKLLTQILLSCGDPADWGSNPSVRADDLRSFGLGALLETTREAYRLDVDKVGRISDPTHPFYVSPQRVLELLNLKNEWGQPDYGFSLEILPALNISANGEIEKSGGERNVVVTVKVTNPEKQPVFGANIIAKLYWTDKNGLHIGSEASGSTDATGSYKFTLYNVRDILKLATGLLIVYVDYHGIRNFKAISLSQIILLGSEGGSLIEEGTIELKPNGPGTYSQWNIYNAGSDWEATRDGSDGTYIYTDSEGRNDTVNIEDFSTIGNIISVTVYARCKATKGGQKAVIILRTNGKDYPSKAFALDQKDFTNYSYTWEKNPSTNNYWTWNEINSLEIGIKADSLKNAEALCSELWVKVDYKYEVPTSGNTVAGYLVGWKFYTSGNLQSQSQKILEVLPIIREGSISFSEVAFSFFQAEGSSYDISYVEPSAIVLLASFKKGSEIYTVYISRAVELKGPRSYRTIPTYPEEQGREFPLSAHSERFVRIGDYTYIARLYIWRMFY